MSVKIMGKVWDMELSPGEKLVLLALADHADHDGNNAYPGNDTLTTKTGMSLRQIQRILHDLEEQGTIVVTQRGDGRGRKTIYSIKTTKGDRATPFAPPEKDDTTTPFSGNGKDDMASPIPEKKGDICDMERVTFATRKGDIRALPYKEEPSLTVHEPSTHKPSGGSVREFLCCEKCGGSKVKPIGKRTDVGWCYRCKTNVNLQAGKPERKKSRALNSDSQEVLNAYVEAFALRYQSAPEVLQVDKDALDGLVKKHGKDQVRTCAVLYLQEPDEFLKSNGYALRFLPHRYSGLVMKAPKPKVAPISADQIAAASPKLTEFFKVRPPNERSN